MLILITTILDSAFKSIVCIIRTYIMVTGSIQLKEIQIPFVRFILYYINTTHNLLRGQGTHVVSQDSRDFQLCFITGIVFQPMSIK